MFGQLAGAKHGPAKRPRGAAGPTCREPRCFSPLSQAVSMGKQPETRRGSSIPVGLSTAGGHSCHTDSLQLCLLPFFLPTSRTSVQDGVHQAKEQLGRELHPPQAIVCVSTFFTLLFCPHFPAPAPLPR